MLIPRCQSREELLYEAVVFIAIHDCVVLLLRGEEITGSECELVVCPTILRFDYVVVVSV